MIDIEPVQTLSRGGDRIVRGWRVEISIRRREFISFVVTKDLQVRHASHWCEGGFRNWLREMWREVRL